MLTGWRRSGADGARLGEVGVESFGRDGCSARAVDVLFAKVCSGCVAALVATLGGGAWYIPAFAVVQLHPVVVAIFHFARGLQCLREEVAQVVVVGRVLEAEVADVGEVLVEFLCERDVLATII